MLLNKEEILPCFNHLITDIQKVKNKTYSANLCIIRNVNRQKQELKYNILFEDMNNSDKHIIHIHAPEGNLLCYYNRGKSIDLYISEENNTTNILNNGIFAIVSENQDNEDY